MIVISYGGAASDGLAGSVLALVPALGPQRTLGWACGYGAPPAGFETVFDGHGVTPTSSSATYPRRAA